MKRRIFLTYVVLIALLAPIIGQQPSTQNQPQTQQKNPQGGDEVVRITTNLVQVDAVVTDKNGLIVTDLKPEEFEILEEGRPQTITNFSFVSLVPKADGPAPNATASKSKNTAPVPPVRLRPEQVRRTIALVVDDLCMAFENSDRVREALRRFVDEQMLPGDLVSIFRARGGNGALQQFTSDKNQLQRAIRQIRWYPPRPGDDCSSEFDDAHSDYTVKTPRSQGSAGARTFESAETKAAREHGDDFRRENTYTGLVGTLAFVTRGLEEMPGRKSIVVISDGLALYNRKGQNDRLISQIDKFFALATRASVVAYSIDARGTTVNPLLINASDDLLPDDTDRVRQGRTDEYNRASGGLYYLANATGGLFLQASDLNVSLRRMLDDQRGFYLLGYRPSDETFKKGTSFRNISVRVKRPGLRVRSRNGFFGVTDEALKSPARTGDSQLYRVLVSPFNAGGVQTRLTTLFGNDQNSANFMRSFLHLDARDITFTDEPGGWKKLVIDVAAVTLGEDGKVVDQFNRTHTIRVGADTFPFVQQNGFIYTADVPIKKPGAYQFRMVVRDAVSQKVGSASQFIEVPDLKKDALALSGIVLTEATADGMPSLPPGAPVESALSVVQSGANPAMRRFQPGMMLSYAHLIYNARLDRATGRPQLTTQLRLYREGKLVFTGAEEPFDPGQQTSFTRLTHAANFRLKASAFSGEYVLQITINDKAGEKPRSATQWIDFEVVR
jgi:VWFA-related protein